MKLLLLVALMCGGPGDIFVTNEEYEAYKRREEAKPRVVRVEGGFIVRRYMRGLGYYNVFKKTVSRQCFSKAAK